MQRAFRVVAGQLPAHQVHIRGEAVGGSHARSLGDAQWRGLGTLEFGVIDQAGFVQLGQCQVAAIQGALGIAPRVVVGRPLDDADQQRDLLGGQRTQFTPEPEFRGRGHAVDGLAATLAHVDLVEVGLEDGALVVARFQDQRVEDLVELARDRDFLADAQQAAARQLLGQGTGALLAFTGRTRGHPDGAGDAGQVDAMVGIEIAVFHRLQAGDQQFGHFFKPHQAALFLLLPVQRGDARRVQPCRLEVLLAGCVTHAGHLATGQRDLQLARGHLAIHVDETAVGNGEAPALVGVGAGAFACPIIAVRRGIQFGLQSLHVHGHARRQVQRARVDTGGNLPLQRAEALGDLMVQVQQVGDHEAQAKAQCGQTPGDQSLAPDRRLIVIVIVVLVVVVVARHGDETMGIPASLAQGATLQPVPETLRSAGVPTECRFPWPMCASNGNARWA